MESNKRMPAILRLFLGLLHSGLRRSLGIAVVVVAVAGCGSDNATAPSPIAVAALTGTYIVDLTKVPPPGTQFNQNDSCQRITVTLTGTMAWAATACTNKDIQPASIELKADSVILNVQPVQFRSVRAYRFGGFTGTADRARAEWVGGTCVDTSIPNVCQRESGTAVWRR